MCVAYLFSQSVTYIFTLPPVSFAECKFSVLTKFYLCIYAFMTLLFVLYLKTYHQIQGHLDSLLYYILIWLEMLAFFILLHSTTLFWLHPRSFWAILSSLNSLQYCFCFMFWFFGHEACGIWAPRPGIKPRPLQLEGEVLTTGPLGKSPGYFLVFPTSAALFLNTLFLRH